MKIFKRDKLAFRVLRSFYKIASFNIKGGLEVPSKPAREGLLSCLIISNKISLLKNILEDLRSQTLIKNDFEVIVVFDGPETEILTLIDMHKEHLTIRFHKTAQPVRILSDLRNISISLSQGQFILFLDDDTRIFQKDFLETALIHLKEGHCDILVPQANPLYGIVNARYEFLDRYSFTSRCSFYQRKTIEEAGGFLKGLQAYEDTELSIRLMIMRSRVSYREDLNYFHPPLYFDTMRKPLAIGQTIFQVRKHYSALVWLLVYINALRFLPYGLIPHRVCQQWFKISLGVALYPFTDKTYYY